MRFFDKSCMFSAFWTFKKVCTNACFEGQHRVSGLFLKGTRSTKCANLTRASRFRAVFGMPNTANVMIVRLKKCVFQQQYRVSAPLEPPNKCHETHVLSDIIVFQACFRAIPA